MTVVHSRYRVALCFVGLCLVFAIGLAIVGPSGDFPLNDDWSFATTARRLALEHDWRPAGWASMSLITQSVLAVPACAATSCSYDALRATSLVASFLLMTMLFFHFVAEGKALLVASVGTMLVIFNPVFYALSYTFMTDVVFALLMTLTTILFLALQRRPSPALLAAACAAAVATTLCRQLGLCVPMAFLVVSVLRADRRAGQIAAAAGTVAVSLLCLVAFERWMKATGRMPSLYTQKSDELVQTLFSPKQLIAHVGRNSLEIALYFGLFLSPLLVLPLRRFGLLASTRRVALVAAGLAVLVAAGLMLVKAQPMPVGRNILVPQGIGPLTLRDLYVLGEDNVPALPVAFWVVVSAISLAGAYRLIAIVVAWVSADGLAAIRRPFGLRDPQTAFLIVLLAIYFAPLVIAGYFDRYVAGTLAIAAMLLLSRHDGSAPGPEPGMAAASVALCMLIGGFSVAATHDYLAWNRARWTAIGGLMRDQGATKDTIDGGFEFNGAASYDPDYRERPDKSWWWVADDRYMVSFGAIPGTTEVGRVGYRTLLPPGERSIRVLRRD